MANARDRARRSRPDRSVALRLSEPALERVFERVRSLVSLEDPALKAVPLDDGDLRLTLSRSGPTDLPGGRVPVYEFQMRLGRTIAGQISLRIGQTREIVLFLGHIGYSVRPRFRGRGLAARSCRLLLPLARANRISELWITCNPDNIASRRTCERLGGSLVEVVDLPPGHPMRADGDTSKCRYRLDLAEVAAP